MKYDIEKVESDNLLIDDAKWNEIESLKIDCCPWEEVKTDIETTVKVVYSETGITVRFETDEKKLKAEKRNNNELVCEDSCLEFFFRRADSYNYINIEVNPLGTLFIGVGEPGNRGIVDFNREMFKVISRINCKTWALQFTVPFAFVEAQIGKLDERFFGNFYKCGDLTDHQHYACWNPIGTEKPCFHVPKYFGELIFK